MKEQKSKAGRRKISDEDKKVLVGAYVKKKDKAKAKKVIDRALEKENLN